MTARAPRTAPDPARPVTRPRRRALRIGLVVIAVPVIGLGGLSLYAALFSGVASDPLYTETADDDRLGTVAIASPDEALTFARLPSGRVLIVTSYRQGSIEGIDLSAALGHEVRDPIQAFLEVGYDAIAAIAVNPADTRAAVDELGIPVDLGSHHIAAAVNFPEHAADSGVDKPFLFPKLVTPTGPHAPVQVGSALLDYEGELAWVTLEPVRQGESPEYLGLILANDYTDRDLLLHHLDPGDTSSGAGFTTGKSLPGFLPVGNLFVIPRDYRSFSDQVELNLYVNGQLRQRGSLGDLHWDVDELLAQTWARKDITWEHRGAQVGLLEDSTVIPARTMILSGTPAGTVFQELTVPMKISGFLSWMFGGWDKSIPQHAIDNYVAKARVARLYLQPGDQVVVHVDHMGVIDNRITS